MKTVEAALSRARKSLESGELFDILARRIAFPTESQNPERAKVLRQYLEEEIGPSFAEMGFTWKVIEHPKAKGSFLLAERIEAPEVPTVFSYGHGDVIRGLDNEWKDGLKPWKMTERDGRWYGRGVADNKGQHTINMEAMRHVIATRGRLGFNAKFLIEMGEEAGSPGLEDVCREHREAMSADVMIASDGPRLHVDRPTLRLGSRGCFNFDLTIESRAQAHHSGNWGGLISSPGIQLANAIATICSATGQIRIPEWVPSEVPPSVRRALADCEMDAGADGPEIEPWWGEPGLTPIERLIGWSSFEVLAFKTGNPEKPINAIPPRAWARCHLRFPVGVDAKEILPALRRHLDRQGFPHVRVQRTDEPVDLATRLDPEDPWVHWVAASMARASGKKTTVLPNSGGSLPNYVFADILGLRTLWVNHSYAACSQHAPNEHLTVKLVREALDIMTSLYWDLGSGGTPTVQSLKDSHR
ncbi:M20 family metallopeptidase [Bradyrhizobium sp. S3.2.12]|uniref:M20 family metallopeptidase n=1 Tax=Bradyrhizobium sp. S3.2.12 TaxID=3156387 RepID=UPI003398C376